MSFCHDQCINHKETTFLKGKHLCFKAFSLIAIIYSTLKTLQIPVSHFPAETGQHVLWDIQSLIHTLLSLLTVPRWACKSIKYSMSLTGFLLRHLSGWIPPHPSLCIMTCDMCMNSQRGAAPIVCCVGISVFTTWNTSIWELNCVSTYPRFPSSLRRFSQCKAGFSPCWPV